MSCATTICIVQYILAKIDFVSYYITTNSLQQGCTSFTETEKGYY